MNLNQKSDEMKTSRRDLLVKSDITVAGAAPLPGFACSGRKRKTVNALQLYCVRNEMSADPLDTLTQLAEMGYTHVEHANYVNHRFYGWAAKEFKEVLDSLGLQMPSGHTVLGKNHWDEQVGGFTDEWKKLVDDAAYIGQQ